ncbi:ATP-binding protein [Flavobacterium sp. CS20]|uniref:sensor histidine kinase n=1 Tax=Flavobacterium sp. CS20 TaxID=2775246 RepID=UPI001B3A22F7|nr:GAF domain-containing sensor histidine kinase [Flavobacterium sp. CS20]QTY27943.1 GAF domain-containing sensor histidine kinase [Flavobacterium sp. CS20]
MQTSTPSEIEQKRLRALKSLNILDSQPEKEYDDLTELVAYICDTPVAMISLIDKDRQWIKSKIGIDFCETERKISFCTHVINQPDEIYEIEDTSTHELFKNNPFVIEEGVRFYAGAPLINENGYALGTICVIDFKPKTLSDQQKIALKNLANQVVKLFELRSKNENLREVQRNLKEKNTQLRNFAGVVSHDMKMPLANIIVTIDILKSKYKKVLDEAGFDYLNNLKQSAFKMSDYISNILTHYESDEITEKQAKENIDLHELLENIIELLDVNDNCEINLPAQNTQIKCNKTAVEQILLNLIGNSLKYNDKEKIIVDIDFSEDDSYYYFSVKDNGIGIPKEKQKDIFKLFSTVAEKDRRGQKGNGIGLSTVRKLINNLGGKIDVESEKGIYTKISFSIEKCE